MARNRIGKLDPIYTLLLNPHVEARLSRCPKCDKLTYPRKFAFFIHVEGHGPYVQAKTCKYCSHCKMIMVQQDELEAQLAHAVQKRFPAALGQEYTVIGVVESALFKKAIAGASSTFDKVLDHVSEIRKQIVLAYSPGGWYRGDHPPAELPAYRPQRIPATASQIEDFLL